MKNTNETNQPQKPPCSPGGHFDKILDELKFIAKDGDASVLFIGETGTGKELLSDYLVQHSDRKENYKKINCVGLSGNLIGSELFGHKKGAFTGADVDREGLIKESNNGILFLDELGAMDQRDQAQLLRVIEDRKVRKIGSDKPDKDVINVRFIAATNRDVGINEKYEDKGIIEDLKARFKYHFHVKPLKERVEDIPYLLKHFLYDIYDNKGQCPFEAVEVEALWCLLLFDWPTNVRQLKNVIEQAKIKRQVWKSKNPNDPSNKILCGFHLSDEITNNFRVTLGKFKEYSDFMEFMRDHSPVPVEDFYSNIATSYWTGEVPEFIDDNTCISVPLDDKFPNRAYEMGIYFEDIINSGVEADLNEEIIKRFGQEVEPDFSRGRKLKFRKNLIHLFDLTLKEAKEKFEMIYYFKKTKKHRNAGQEKLAELFGFSSTQSLRDMQSRLGIKPVKKKKKKDNAK